MLAQNIAPKPATLPPAVQASLPANNAGGPSFAQFLTEQAAAPAPPTDAEPSEAANAADAAPAPAAPTRRAPVAAKPAGPARTPDGAAKAEPKADAMAAADAGKSEAMQAGDEESPDTPELKEFTQLIGMNTAAASAPDAAVAVAADGQRAARRGRADATADDAATGRPAGRSPLDAAAGATDAGQTPQAKAADRQASQADERAARSDALQAMSSATQTTQDAPPAAAQPTPGTPSFAAVLAQAMPALPAQADATTTTARAALHEPLHSAAFAPELGTRVSLLAVDGVQHAELQLNPADMGPVSVQIVVDGNQAQVSFHALQAETRQALEQSLPDLAAALQGQGLTLAGGGVFQQASRDADPGREGANAGDGTRSAGGGNEPAAGSSAPVRRTVGLLDTFA